MGSIFNLSKDNKLNNIIIKSDGNGEKRTTYLKDADGNLISIGDLMEQIQEILKEREEDVDRIRTFGAGLLDSSMSFGFMIGWVTKTIIEALEHSQMKDAEHGDNVKISINMDKEELSRDDVIDTELEQMQMFIDLIKENRDNPDIKLNNITNPIKSGIGDGTEDYA
jgi:hypothetical protein